MVAIPWVPEKMDRLDYLKQNDNMNCHNLGHFMVGYIRDENWYKGSILFSPGFVIVIDVLGWSVPVTLQG